SVEIIKQPDAPWSYPASRCKRNCGVQHLHGRDGERFSKQIVIGQLYATAVCISSGEPIIRHHAERSRSLDDLATGKLARDLTEVKIAGVSDRFAEVKLAVSMLIPASLLGSCDGIFPITDIGEGGIDLTRRERSHCNCQLE